MLAVTPPKYLKLFMINLAQSSVVALGQAYINISPENFNTETNTRAFWLLPSLSCHIRRSPTPSISVINPGLLSPIEAVVLKPEYFGKWCNR